MTYSIKLNKTGKNNNYNFYCSTHTETQRDRNIILQCTIYEY